MEPCVGCGRETAAGTPQFVDRRLVARTPSPSYLCVECSSTSEAEREDRQSEADLRRAVDNAVAAGIRWGGSGGPGFGGA